MNEERYNEFCDNTLKEIGEFIKEELGYETSFMPKGQNLALSTLAIGIPKDEAGRERYLSLMVFPADIEGCQVTFLQMHIIFNLEISEEARPSLEALAARVNEKFMLGSFVFFFNSLCMKYGLAFDRQDGVDLLDLTRSLSIFVWQADVFGDAFAKLAAGEVSLREAISLATGE
jgi:tRNA U34 5-methylaminomethyl-2-thiouridine-forming methyltransferase MnmC